MKKTFLLLLILFVCGIIIWNNNSSLKSQEIILSQKYEIENKKQGKILAAIKSYSFKEATKESDLVAKIKIGNIVKEDGQPYVKTIFNAEVLEVFKSNDKIGKSINIMQQGNSQFTFNNNELFQNGDEYYLFLKETVNYPLENTYWILGEETTFYKIEEDEVIKASLVDEDLREITKKIKIDSTKDGKEKQHLNKEKFELKLKQEVEKYR